MITLIKMDGIFLAKFPTADTVGVPSSLAMLLKKPVMLSIRFASCSSRLSGRYRPRDKIRLPALPTSSSSASQIRGSSWTKPMASRTRMEPTQYPAPMTKAMAATMTMAEPAFLRIRIFSSRKRTRGLAIRAITQPTTNGMKKRRTRGSTNSTSKSTARAVIRFRHTFTYLTQGCFIGPPPRETVHPAGHKFLPVPVWTRRRKELPRSPSLPAGLPGWPLPVWPPGCG